MSTESMEKNGRDARGRFSKGNPGGPGNPYARYTAELRKAFTEEAKEEDLRKLARVMIERAMTGDVAAARIVLSYTLGKPMEAVDPDRVDELECKQWAAESMTAEQGNAVLCGVGAGFLSQMLRAAVPVLSEIHGQALLDALTAPVESDDECADLQEEPQAGGAPPKVTAETAAVAEVGEQREVRTADEVVADIGDANREALRQVAQMLGLPDVVPMSAAVGKRFSTGGKAANGPLPESDRSESRKPSAGGTPTRPGAGD